jgi:phosphate transport system substrate-binding protein
MRASRFACFTAALALSAVALSACGKGAATEGKMGEAPKAGDISGAGATFPAPLYSKWAETYKGQTQMGLNYQAIGSGGGIKQIKAKTVDFGASDKPLKPDELAQAGLYQFPTVMGGVVPVVNLPGVGAGQIRLSGAVLASIYLGEIKTWNAPEIAKLNPGVKLPAMAISVVHRSDGSGTSFLYTTYLSMVSPGWKTKVGASDSVSWPTGLGGKGNDGVAAFVKQTPGSIGYVEYAYAKQNKLASALLQNKSGAFVAAAAEDFAAAAEGADWAHAQGNYILLLDQPAAKAWPITGATFILMHRQQADAARGKATLKFFDWSYTNGDAEAAKLDYVPLPAAVKAMVRQQWTTEVKGADGKPVWTGQ